MTPRRSSPDAPAHAPTVLVAGGGSAGHVSPMLATAEALRVRYPAVRVLALGTAEGLEADLVPAAGFDLLTIQKVPFPRRVNRAAAAFPRDFAREVRRVRGYLEEFGVDAIAGFGGYVCPPAYLAGMRTGRPLVIHEANKRPGLANRLGARRAAHVATAFDVDDARGGMARAVTLGMPMRSQIATLDRGARRAEARASFGLEAERPTLLVTGGSLGALRLNETLVAALPGLAEAGVQVLHITGRGKRIEASGAHYHQVEYVTAMEDAYAAADFAVTRSGAGTVSELAAVGLPALFVPLPIGNGEQALNGNDVVAAGGARMIADADLTPDALIATVRECLVNPEILASMSEAARRFGVRDAAERLADLIASTIPALSGGPAQPSADHKDHA
ncbi:MAG: undecaprenyldiphospho-muramoylpentapeptide beta-N-acetylglucosaminyltransferase [Dermabacter sp.]|nr:undecaprenyldiphospho-muramoylpentapeptide beta-N-acetylglucosaminyltransferase [Dermabacter sp.]